MDKITTNIIWRKLTEYKNNTINQLLYSRCINLVFMHHISTTL